MLCGSRLSPIEKRGKCWRSSTNTERPARRRSAAATAPAGPAPMIATSTVMRFDECVLKVASIVCLHGTALRCALTFRYNYASQQEQYFVGEPSVSPSETSSVPFVPETAFGIWFLRTYTWEHHVLRVAINDLKRLIDAPLPAAPVIVDVGCRSEE